MVEREDLYNGLAALIAGAFFIFFGQGYCLGLIVGDFCVVSLPVFGALLGLLGVLVIVIE